MADDLRLLKSLVRNNLMTQEQARRQYKLFQQSARSKALSLSDWLAEKGVLTREQIRGAQPDMRRRTPPPVLPIESNDSQSDHAQKAIPEPANTAETLNLAESLKLSPKERHAQLEAADAMRFGPYVVHREIARGGMGAVYEVSHPTFGHPLALKVLLARSMASERQKRRFQREIETVQRLNHPGIIRVLDAGTVEDIDFLVMEFVDGPALDEVFLDRGLELKRLLEIIASLARALDHAHAGQVIHRDLKPANILLRKNGEPVITDFGLAKDLLDSAVLSKSGTVIGTPRYLSPEQTMALHDQIGPTTDIYALGVILFEGLTGDRPFDSESVEQLYQMIEDQPPPDPSKLNEKVPADVSAICLKALEKQQSDRYQSGAAMAADIETFLKTGRVKVRRAGISARLPQWTSDRGAQILMLIVAIALALFLGALLSRSGQSPDEPINVTTDPEPPFSRRGE